MTTISHKDFLSRRFGPADLLRLELAGGDVVRAYDLRHLKEAKWLRVSSWNHNSFCLRRGENPHSPNNTIGWVSTTDFVNIFRHGSMIVFRDMIAAIRDLKKVSCYVLPQNIVMSWPLSGQINGKKVDVLVPANNGAVFVPAEYR